MFLMMLSSMFTGINNAIIVSLRQRAVLQTTESATSVLGYERWASVQSFYFLYLHSMKRKV